MSSHLAGTFTSSRVPGSFARTDRDPKEAALLDKAMKKSMGPHLEPGEELLNVTIVLGKGMMRALVAGGAVGAAAVGALRDRKAPNSEDGNAGDAAGVELSSKMGLAITPRRVLIFKAGGAVTVKAQELLSDIPIADVDSIEVGKGALTKPVTFTVRGESFRVEAPKAANTDKLVSAFEQAKGGSAVTDAEM
jgi:hypothetical protein